MNPLSSLRLAPLIGISAAFLLPLPLPAAGPAKPALTKADFERAMTELSNWGRWGQADELGALNLITPEKRREAAKLVREGVPVSLSHQAVKEAGR